MTAPVVAGLARAACGVRITIRTAIPERSLRNLIEGAFDLAAPPPDPALAMLSPFEVDVAASERRYAALFARWDEHVDTEAAKLRALKPDLVVANVPFVSLAAARACGVAAVALGPLNWADIYAAYCGGQPGAEAIHAEMLGAYRSARVFMQSEPAMPMTDLPNRRRIGPVARRGQPQRDRLRRVCGAGADERFVLVSFGGIPRRRVFELPRIDRIRWLVPDDYEAQRRDLTRHSASGLSFIDLLASCDVLLTKPGYGMFVEAACNGVKMAFLPRDDWPESPYLTRWLQSAWIARELGEKAFLEGAIAHDIELLAAMPTPPPVVPAGVDDAVAVISDLLDGAR